MNRAAHSKSFGRLVGGALAVWLVFMWAIGALHQNAAGSSPGLALGVPDSNCVGVVVVASQEKSDLLAKLAYDYDQHHRGSDCVDVRVNALASGNAEAALARGWTSADGPQPTVWTPAATSWLAILR